MSEQNEATAVRLLDESPPVRNGSGFIGRDNVPMDYLLLDEYSRAWRRGRAVAAAVVNIEIEQRVKIGLMGRKRIRICDHAGRLHFD